MREVKVRCLRPFLHRGRYVSTGERVWLLTHDADVLLESGHVAVVISSEQAPSGDRWVHPQVRTESMT
jgi:hypothetical protein